MQQGEPRLVVNGASDHDSLVAGDGPDFLHGPALNLTQPHSHTGRHALGYLPGGTHRGRVSDENGHNEASYLPLSSLVETWLAGRCHKSRCGPRRGGTGLVAACAENYFVPAGHAGALGL